MTQITAAAEAAIRSRIGAISGVEIAEVRSRNDRQATPPGRRRVTVDVKLSGWSPSLHRLPMHWTETVNLREGATGVEQVRDMRAMFAPRLKRQAERLAQGIAMGMAVPLYAGTEHDRIDVMHIVVDRALADMIGDRDALIARLQRDVGNLHQAEDDGLRDELHGDDSLVGRSYSTSHELADGVLYYGNQLWTRKMLPQTILDAAPGRALDDIVGGLPGDLGSRIIQTTRIADDDYGCELNFAPDAATVREILSERGGKMVAG